MCDGTANHPTGVTRRAFLLGGVALGVTPMLVLPSPAPASVHTVALPDGRSIRERDAWGADLPPVGPVLPEPDVRFLLVHHTAGANVYSADTVPATLRSIYGFHTSAEKGWADVAYNFFVDREGGIWEGRAGSLAGAVQGDATGGSQGYAQLCCFLGNHSLEPPTDEATHSMLSLLAWLADRHGLDTRPGSTTTFESRGSNLWPTGITVTTATIAGHRDMSATECPGDLLYPAVRDRYPAEVTARRVGAPTSVAPSEQPDVSASTETPPSTVATTTDTTVASTTTSGPTSTTSPVVPGESATAEASSGGVPSGPDPNRGPDRMLLAAGAVAVAGAAAVGLLHSRRPRDVERTPAAGSDDESEDGGR